MARHLNGHPAAKDVHWEFIKVVLNSASNTAIIPMQDVLGLGDEARVNRPSTLYHNWEWRMKPGALRVRIVKKLAQLTRAAKRDR